MGPHKFIIGTVTEAALQAIESVNGTVEPHRRGDMHKGNLDQFMVTLPALARYGAIHQWCSSSGTRWKSIAIHVGSMVLLDIVSHEDPEGTLDIADATIQQETTQ